MKRNNLIYCLFILTALFYACKVKMATTTPIATTTAATTAVVVNQENSVDLPPLAPFSTMPLTPEQSLAAFHVPEGYHIELECS